MSTKNIAFISYLTFIGWIIAFVFYNDSKQKESLAAFHLRQSLGVQLTIFILSTIPPFFGIFFASSIAGIISIVIWVVGFISALQGEEKEIPIVGALYQDWFKSIG
jgi:uncharacterized membrane protein